MDEHNAASAPGLGEYWQLLCRRRWWILGTFFSVWALAWAASWILPPRYRSETLILVEQQQVPQEYVVSNVTTDMQERLQTLTQQILSRTRLQRIIEDFHLYPRYQNRLSSDQMVEYMRKDIDIEVVENPGKQELSAFRISYTAADPRLAQRVASELSSLFIQENLSAQQQQSENTTQFLSAELEQARQALADQEAQVRDFKTRYLGELPSQMQSNMEILTGLQSRYEGLTTSLNHSRQQKLYLESLLSHYRAMGITSSKGTPASDTGDEIASLQKQLDAARALYTDSHPEVVRLRSELAKAEKRRQQLAADAEGSQSPDAKGTQNVASSADAQAMSPILQLESQWKANEQEIKDTMAQMKVVEQQIHDYQGRLNISPIREQKLADLTRGYDQSKANYDSLLKKQMQSQMATNLEKQEEGQQFRILDPPSLPKKAFFPDRIKFSLGGLAGGLALGLMIAFLIEKIGDHVRTERDLREIKVPSGIEIISTQVLAGIPHMTIPGEERRHKWGRFLEVLAATLLLAIIGFGNAISFLRG
jgi:polysaccharide chain length determinant protein (PEP-CTERM system associated)